MTTETPLSNDELLELAQDRIDDLPSGEYQVSEIFGDLYEAAVVNPKAFGKTFKAAVVSGALRSIRLGRLDIGDKHWRYDLHGG